MAAGKCATRRASWSWSSPRTSTTPALTVEGELDDISGSGQTRAAHDLCSGIVSDEQRHFEVKGAGHYGIFSGSRWRTQVYPVVKKFILEHQAAAAPAAVKTEPIQAEAAVLESAGAPVQTAVTEVAYAAVETAAVTAEAESVLSVPASQQASTTQARPAYRRAQTTSRKR